MPTWLAIERKILEECAKEGLTQVRTINILAAAGYIRNRNQIARFATRNGIKFSGEPYRFGNQNRWKNQTKRGQDPEKTKARDKRYRKKLKEGHIPIPRERWLLHLAKRRSARIVRNTKKEVWDE